MICVTHGSIGAAVPTPHPQTTRRFGFLDSWRQSCGASSSCSQRTGLESLRSNSWNASPVNGSWKRAVRHGYTTYVRRPRPVDEGSAPQPIIVNSRNMPSVSEVTLALAALANPARREVAYRAAVWQAGNGSHKRSAAQTTLIAAWWCEAGGLLQADEQGPKA
jgi:hypothetical protein